MARSIIGSLWNPAQRNELNRMLEELYTDIGNGTNAERILNEFLNGTGVVSSKMLQTNSVHGNIIREDGIGTRHLLDGTVTNDKISQTLMKTLNLNSEVKNDQQLFDKSNVAIDKAVNTTNGQLINLVGFVSSDYIKILPGEQLQIRPTIGSSALYDANKNFVTGITSDMTNPITVPKNAVYLRTSMHRTSLDDKMVYHGSGNIPYQQYRKDEIDTFKINVLASLIPLETNLFDRSKVIEDRAVSSVDGTLVVTTGFFASDYIMVQPASSVMVLDSIGSGAFYDKDKQFITGVSSDLNNPLQVPADAYYLRISTHRQSLPTRMVYIGDRVIPYHPFMNEVNEGLNHHFEIEEYVNLFDKDTVMQDKAISSSNGDVVDTDNFVATKFIEITPDAELMITPNVGSGAFYDANKNFLQGIKSDNTNPIKIPAEAYFIRTSMARSSASAKMVYLGNIVMDYVPYIPVQESDSYLVANNRIEIDPNNLGTVTTLYEDDSNIHYSFGKLGINDFYHLKQIKTDYFNHNVTTDWLSPHRVKANINPIADNTMFVTGGNHGSDGSAGGFRTGEPVSIEYFIDNKKLVPGIYETEKPIVVKVTNKLCGYNTIDLGIGTRRDIIREIITYKFTRNNVEVSVEVEALENNVEIWQYRGIQFHLRSWMSNAQTYVPTDDTGIVDISTQTSFKSTAEGSEGTRLVAFNTNDDTIVLSVNDNFGLGDFKENETFPRWWYNASKGYSNLTRENAGIVLNQLQSLTWSGGYYFGKGLPRNGNEKAYYVPQNGKRVYCVDSFESSNGHIELLPEDENKEVKIIKSKNFTCDDFTTSKGLKYSTTGNAGQLMFEVI